MTRAVVALLVALCILAGACTAPGGGEPPLVATTTWLLADVVRSIGEDDVEVVPLIPAGADPERHPGRPLADMERRPDLVVTVGLGFEGGMADLVAEARTAGIPVVEVAPVGEPLAAADGTPDPRVWLDPLRMASTAPVIAFWLTGLVPEPGVAYWQGRGRAYADRLRSLHGVMDRRLEVVSELAAGSPGLEYVAQRYGLDMVEPPRGSVIVDATDQVLAEVEPGSRPVPVALDDLGGASGYADFLSNLADAIVDEGR
ncbi:MAG: zinc ABC transporter substrate-binding protein [Acidimicrobiia bacterium]|jgi:zinc/manganese transport system substrate-binding protein